MYSKYNELFFKEMKNIADSIIEENIERISSKEQMLQSEFWYILIFHNCPYINQQLKITIDNMISLITPNSLTNHPDIIRKLLIDFLQLQSINGNKPKESFFCWNEKINVSEQITYRTYQRTIFKNYRGNKYGLFASIE
jgi:hypothetical protein